MAKKTVRQSVSADSVYAVSGSLYELARSRGIPEHKARRVVAYAPPQHGHGERFKTRKDQKREHEWVNTECLRWLLDFVQDGYKTAVSRREGWDLEVFLWSYAPPPTPNSRPRGKARSSDIELPTLAQIERLRQELAPAVIWLLRDSKEGQILNWRMRLSGGNEVRLQFMRIGGKPLAQRFWFDWRAAFLMHATELIQSCGSQVKKCLASGCERLFVPNKRQAFCSRSCSVKERQRKFRQQFTKEEWSERRHKFYQKRVAALFGHATAERVRRRDSRKSNSSPRRS